MADNYRDESLKAEEGKKSQSRSYISEKNNYIISRESPMSSSWLFAFSKPNGWLLIFPVSLLSMYHCDETRERQEDKFLLYYFLMIWNFIVFGQFVIKFFPIFFQYPGNLL